MKECPCKNCITFILCKNKIILHYKYIYTLIDVAHIQNCEMLKNFSLKNRSIKRLNEGRRLFGFPPLS
jgi:hypothetical protein